MFIINRENEIRRKIWRINKKYKFQIIKILKINNLLMFIKLFERVK